MEQTDRLVVVCYLLDSCWLMGSDCISVSSSKVSQNQSRMNLRQTLKLGLASSYNCHRIIMWWLILGHAWNITVSVCRWLWQVCVWLLRLLGRFRPMCDREAKWDVCRMLWCVSRRVYLFPLGHYGAVRHIGFFVCLCRSFQTVSTHLSPCVLLHNLTMLFFKE